MKPTPSIRHNDYEYGKQTLYDSYDLRSENEQYLTHPGRSLAGRKIQAMWLYALWPLLLHGALAVIIAAFVLAYVDGRNFNISKRRPTVRLQDGSLVPWISFAPLQSDITTILSVAISILRLVAAGWLGSLCWRCALILMEEVGIKSEQLHFLVSYGFTISPLRTVANKKPTISWLVWAILFLTIPTQFAAPVLTGSITWVAGHYPPQQLPNSIVSTFLVGMDTPVISSSDSSSFPDSVQHLREHTARVAANYDFVTWGREVRTDTLRRFLPDLGLEANSTLANITIPHFSVQSIEWVKDPKSTLGVEQLDIKGVVCPRITATSNGPPCPIFKTAISLIPDTPWSVQTLTAPRALAVSERRLMVKRVGTIDPSQASGCTFDNNETRTGWISSNTIFDNSIYLDRDACYVYAWVNYTAGASTCYNCPVLGYGTVEGNANLPMLPDYLTDISLRLMPDVVAFMGDLKFNDMGPSWEKVEEDVIGTLMRSYAASWMALTEAWGPATAHNTTYSISAPASRASVNILRVYLWLGLHSLITLSGVLFIYVQTQLGTPVIADTTLTAFYLDTGAMYEYDGDHEVPIMRRVEIEGDRLRLKTE
ncbi:unnamed protein product [Rhizoctonia solani]|uniref:Transmembrane protein n=1 Tax=Rhizoctonia solani TaxID=456999 RepID=A0A8H3C8D2_9AGAM|nr:unnamed protein product [Rhizoctonia solani]